MSESIGGEILGENDLSIKLNTIVEISQLVTSSKSFYSIKDKVVDKMLNVISPKKACVNIFDRYEYKYAYLVCKDTLDYIPKLFEKDQTPQGPKIHIDIYPPYIKEAIEAKKPIYIKRLSDDPRAAGELEIANKEGYVGRAVFPLISSNSVVGFMTCFLEEGEELSSTDVDFIDSVALLLGLSMEITRYNGDIDRIVKKLREAIASIAKATDELYKNKGIDSFFTMISEQVCKLTNSEASLIVVEDHDIRVNTMAKFGKIEDFSHIVEFVFNEENKQRDVKLFSKKDLPKHIVDMGITSLIFEPLKKENAVIGHLIAINSKKYYNDDLKILAIYASQIVLSLIMYINSRRIFDNKLMERDLEIVGKQQELIMSDKHMRLDGCVAIDYYYSPSRQIGGDFCKLVRMDDNRAIVFIADVMGHGILSNYFVAMMKGVLKTLLSEELTPSNILNRMNRILYNDLDALNLFITARIMYLDFDKNIAISSNAGHLFPLSFFRDEAGNLKYSAMQTDEGIPLGVMEDAEYEQHTYDISDVEMIALYTDGIIEAGNIDELEYGTEGLAEFLINNSDKTGEEICDMISDEMHRFTGTQYMEDDVMLVIVKREMKECD